VLQYDAVCCSALQCVAVRGCVLKCIAVCCSVWQCVLASQLAVSACCSVLQCVAVCCSVCVRVSFKFISANQPQVKGSFAERDLHKSKYLQHTATRCNALQHTATSFAERHLHRSKYPQHTATHCNISCGKRPARCKALQHTDVPAIIGAFSARAVDVPKRIMAFAFGSIASHGLK